MRGPPIRPTIDPKEVKATAVGLTAFASDLYAQLRSRSGNLLVSPYSIGLALAMAASGAKGNTFAEMQKVLRLPTAEKLGAAFRGLTVSILATSSGMNSRSELLVANALWAQQGHPWKPGYLTTIRDDFQGELFGVDFQRDAQSIPNRINQWVADSTRGLIKNLIPPNAFDQRTRIVLTNAIYFKARWSHVFERANTRTEDFITATGSRVKAPLMYQRSWFGLGETGAYQVLRLPYSGGDTSIYVILPRTQDGLPDLERRLTAESFAWWTTDITNGDVQLWLPRFRFNAGAELGSLLQSLGLADAFIPTVADFTGMTEHPEGLFLNNVLHQARIEVDEMGTVAAAASAGGGGGSRVPPKPKVFRADHPFLFAITHEPTGAILFLGRVEDPTK